MLYSQSTCGFYSTEIHGSNIPADAIEITDEAYAALLDGQSQGKRIVPDAGGHPVLIDGMAAPLTLLQMREAQKAARAAAVDAIKVTTQAGNTFDGDEISQGRMARAILALQATSTPSVTWVLADNSVIQASDSELSEALALAGAAQAALWVLP